MSDEPTYNIFFNYPSPLTTTLVVFMIGLYIYHFAYRIEPELIAFRYELITRDHQWWRCITCTFSHLGIFHIIMNMYATYVYGSLYERQHGTLLFAKYTFLIILGTNFFMIFFGFLLNKYKPEWLYLTNGAGFSGVLFGYLGLFYLEYPFEYTPLLGFITSIQTPNILQPFILLIVWQILTFNQVSFFGHLSGLLMGAAIAWRAFDWVSDDLFYAGLVWATIGFIYSAKTTQTYVDISCIKIPEDQRVGRDMRIVNGQVYYNDRAPSDQV